jgi:hypothetical protein
MEANAGQGYLPCLEVFIQTTSKEETTMRRLRGKGVKTVKKRTLIATVDIGQITNTGYCTTPGGRDTKPFRFDNTKEGFEKFWCMNMASKNRFRCDEVLVGCESTGPHARPVAPGPVSTNEA